MNNQQRVVTLAELTRDKKFDFRDVERYALPTDQMVQLTVSGGRSSGYQFMHICAHYDGKLPNNIIACFQNTGKEREETLDFVHAMEKYTGCSIAWIERNMAHPFKVQIIDFDRADRKGGPFMRLYSETVPKRKDGSSGVRPLPNPVQRSCTAELKIKTADRYLTKILGWERPYCSVIGYRADEQKRIERRVRFNKKRPREAGGIGIFPMADAGVDSGRVHNFWNDPQAPFNLELSSEEGNCDFCFMKSTWKIKYLMVMHPERIPFWLNLEARGSDRSDNFRKDRPSLQQLWDEVQRGDMGTPQKDKLCGTCGI